MKQILLKAFSPILNKLETDENDQEFVYSASHRKIMAVMGLLFLGVATAALYFSIQINQLAGILPVVLFGGIGFICLIVAFLGSDKAVAKLWRNRS